MHVRDHSNVNVSSESEIEISLPDIIQFIEDSWRKIILACLLGAIVGFGGWFFLSSYHVELYLQNNGGSIDQRTWRTLQYNLPNLANQVMSHGKLSSEEAVLFGQLYDATWWLKNVKPIYEFSKQDIKDLVVNPKNIDGVNNKILGLNITVSSKSKDTGIQNVRQVAEFLRKGSIFLSIKDLLIFYEGVVVNGGSDIQLKISKSEIELAYLRDRVKNLEDLLKRFPVNSYAAQQVVDPKDSGAKYLPLATQIIAANNDINQNKENLVRFKNQLNQITLIKNFLAEAKPLADEGFDGVLLSKALLAIEERLRKQLPPSDINNLQALDKIRSELLEIYSRFDIHLVDNKVLLVKKTGMVKSTAGGIFCAGFLMLAFLLGRKVLGSQKAPAKS